MSINIIKADIAVGSIFGRRADMYRLEYYEKNLLFID